MPTEAWEQPAPCEGWVARDVVGHLVEWVPGFLGAFADLPVTISSSVATDPAAAWHELDRALRDALDDPAGPTREVQGPMGSTTLEALLDQFVTTDILIHTWDLARATGLDERLDPQDYAGLLEGMEAYDEALRTSGHYGPRVPVPDDADEQARLLAFLGRDPSPTS